VSIELVLPTVFAIAFGAVAGLVRWPGRPAIVMRLLAGIAGVTAVTVFLVVSVGAVGLLARSALVMSLIDWCPVVPLHHDVGYLEGGFAVAVTVVGTIRMVRVVRRRRRAAGGMQGRRLCVLETAEPIAYAAPGKPGCVVVSRGMLNALGPRERQVVFAHERAHLRHHHHRYLLVGELAVAVLPVLRPLADQLQLATERSADEAAVRAMGGDRPLVARTIARAAITSSSYHGLVGAFGGGSVPARVRALIGPASSPARARFGLMAGGATVVAALAAGSVQVHHVARLAGHLCHL
jgi:Zn-dependent protease with chaperone function